MVLYSNFLRLNGIVAASTNLLVDRLHISYPLVDGYMALSGSTSGHVNLQASAATTTYTITFPANSGSSGQFLQTNGSGVTTWTNVSTSPTLNEVYGNDPNGGNVVITTTPTDGYVEIAGTEGLVITGATGLYIENNTAFDGYIIGNGFTNAWLSPLAAGDIKINGNFEAQGNIAIHSNNNAANNNYLYVQNVAETNYSAIDQTYNGGTDIRTNLSAVSTSVHSWLRLRADSAITAIAELEATNNIDLTSLAGKINLSANQGIYIDGYAALLGSTSGQVVLQAAAVTTTHTLILPVSQGAANSVLTNDSAGNLSWTLANSFTTLQNAYKNDVDGSDATITTDSTDGHVVVGGTEGLRVTGAKGLVVAATAGATGNLITVPGTGDIYATGRLEVDGAARFDSTITVADNINIASTFGVENTVGSSTLNIGSSGNTATLNLGTGSNTNVINVGTGAGTTTINLGGSGDTVNVAGTLTYVNTTNLEVTDKLITINKGGATSSGNASGIAVEENGILEGYAYVGNSRQSWDFIAPASNGTFRLTPHATNISEINTASLTATRTYTLPDESGVIALQGSIIVDLENDVTGVLPLVYGGTGASLTANAGAVVYSDGYAFGLTTIGTNGQVLKSNDISPPSFGEPDKLYISLANNTGSTIMAGSVVILSQSFGGEMELADASALLTCEGVVGVVESSILDTESGRVQIAGRCSPIPDTSFTLGKRVYVCEIPGYATSTAPSTIGTVIFTLGSAISTTDIILNMHLDSVN